MSAAKGYTTCVVCGLTSTADRMVYSRWTGNHYCLDEAGCASRVQGNLDGLAGRLRALYDGIDAGDDEAALTALGAIEVRS